MLQPGQLPKELTDEATAFIAITGLDVTYNAVHTAIWDAFSNNRKSDRAALHFQLLSGDHEYIKPKQKKTSYEWFVPKGLLKSSWIKKVLHLIPAVLIIFYDLDWDEVQWNERKLELASRVEVARSALHNRGTRIGVVLVQRNIPLPPGEDMVAAEKAAQLCAACDLQPKCLFVLPQTDHLLGYIVRLENAFCELAQAYYHSEIRAVKGHRDYLNRTTHMMLFARHQFKMAFYNEIKQDFPTAVKHYGTAYSYLQEFRIHDNNNHEIKTVAGFINYKMCKLLFRQNNPNKAISQFRLHIDFFKEKTGPLCLAFEHSAWLSKQFSIFGELFDEAVREAIQTQHPGFYYQQAANYATQRKELCIELCADSTSYPEVDPLTDSSSLEYFGQRPWRPGYQSIEPPSNLQKEREGILSLKYLENRVDHSALIIPLLNMAVKQFKKYQSVRMKRHLMVIMAEEYYHAKEYSKALALLSGVMWDYRSERWWSLLTHSLHMSLRCVYLMRIVQDYIIACAELISKYTTITVKEKRRVQENMVRVIKGQLPEAEPGCPNDCVDKAVELWTNRSESTSLTIEMNNIAAFIESRCIFLKSSFSRDATVELVVVLHNTAPLPIRLSKLCVLFNKQEYNSQCVIIDTKDMDDYEPEAWDLCLLPDVTKVFKFEVLLQPEGSDATIEVESVILSCGYQSGCDLLLRWQGGGGCDIELPASVHADRKKMMPDGEFDKLAWSQVPHVPATSITPREGKVEISVTHYAPALLSEYYAIVVSVTNSEGELVSGVSLMAHTADMQNSANCLFCEEPSSELCGALKDVKLPDIPRGDQAVKTIFMRCHEVSTQLIVLKVAYKMMSSGGQHYSCTSDHSFHVDVVDPFELTFRVTNMKFQEIEKVNVDDPFLVTADIRNLSQWPLVFRTSSWTPVDGVRSPDQDSDCLLAGVFLNREDVMSDCHCLIVNGNDDKEFSTMGSYSVDWKRRDDCGDKPSYYVQKKVALPPIYARMIPLSVRVDLPAVGEMDSPIPISYTICNRTARVQDMEVVIEPSESFMFVGYKQLSFRILPHDNYQLSYSLLPLAPGCVPLPRLQVNMTRCAGVTNLIVQDMMPNHIFVMPQGRKQTVK